MLQQLKGPRLFQHAGDVNLNLQCRPELTNSEHSDERGAGLD